MGCKTIWPSDRDATPDVSGERTADLIYHGTQKELAFCQRSFAIGRTLTLTAGLRWEGQWNPVSETESGIS
jgi:hypothetical protein